MRFFLPLSLVFALTASGADHEQPKRFDTEEKRLEVYRAQLALRIIRLLETDEMNRKQEKLWVSWLVTPDIELFKLASGLRPGRKIDLRVFQFLVDP